MTSQLPTDPSLKHLRLQAKNILKAFSRGDSSCCGVLRHLHQFKDKPDVRILANEVSLAEVQFALAIEYGFKNWAELKKYVVERIENKNDSFVRNLTRAREIIGSKGPHENSTQSDWEKQRHGEMMRLLEMGDEGVRVMLELAKSESGKHKSLAAIFFGLTDDKRGREVLQDLMHDEVVMVRSRAIRFYAALIHPDICKGDMAFHRRATRIPEGAEIFIPCLRDSSIKIRMQSIGALSAYTGMGNSAIDSALEGLLDDTKHKIRHAAAKALACNCPSCGVVPT